MPDVYYNNASSNNFEDPGNWWSSLNGINGGTVDNPLGFAPNDTTYNVYILGDISPTPEILRNLGYIYVGLFETECVVNLNNISSISDIQIYYTSIVTVTRAGQGYSFNDSSSLSASASLTGQYSFNTSSINYGSVSNGGASGAFNDNSSNLGTVEDNVYFNNQSINYGTAETDATFAIDARNYGIVEGNATFEELTGGSLTNVLTYGTGIVNGNIYDLDIVKVTQLSYSYTNIDSPAIFSNTDLTLYFEGLESDADILEAVDVSFVESTNNGDISGISNNVNFSYCTNNANLSDVGGNINFYTTTNGGDISNVAGNINFEDASINGGSGSISIVTGAVNFTGGSANNKPIDNVGLINFTGSTNYSNISNVATDVSFVDSTNGGNISNVTGDITFTGVFNFGTVSGDVQFLDLTVEPGGILLTATGIGGVSGTATDSNSDEILKVKYLADSTYPTNFVSIFDNVNNASTVDNDAYFYNNSVNSGTVNGDAYFYKGAWNQGTVEGVIFYKDGLSTLAALAEGNQIGGAGVEIPFSDILGTGLQ
jgi:hypothetical protein